MVERGGVDSPELGFGRWVHGKLKTRVGKWVWWSSPEIKMFVLGKLSTISKSIISQQDYNFWCGRLVMVEGRTNDH